MPRLPDTAFFALVPDWVCEILSPSTAPLDRAKKLGVYAREDVPHAWLIDPSARTLEALELHEGRWSILDTHLGDAVVRVPPFADVDIPLRTLWGED
jgi:Uma2 family endonuclease